MLAASLAMGSVPGAVSREQVESDRARHRTSSSGTLIHVCIHGIHMKKVKRKPNSSGV